MLPVFVRATKPFTFARECLGDRTLHSELGRHDTVDSLSSGDRIQKCPKRTVRGAKVRLPLLFYVMTPLQIKTEIEILLTKPFNTRVLLNMARMINESDRRTSSYTDPNYIPFYYHLGKLIKPKAVVEVGLRLGLTGAAFLRSCQSVEEYLALQVLNGDDYYSSRLAKANIRDHYRGVLYTHAGSIEDDNFSASLEARLWDLVVINDEFSYDDHLLTLETLWPCVSSGGYLVCDYTKSHPPTRKAWDGFCVSRNLKSEFVDTRYGVSIAQRD